MAKIHMILQGKGRAGKSFIAATLALHKLWMRISKELHRNMALLYCRTIRC